MAPRRPPYTDMMLSIGGVVGRLSLGAAPAAFLEQVAARYDAFRLPPADWVDRAFAQAREHAGLYLEAAAPLLIDRVDHLRKCDGGRLRRRHDMSHDELLWRRLGEGGSTSDREDPRKPTHCALQQAKNCSTSCIPASKWRVL